VVGHDLYVTLSIGIAVFPDDGAEGDSLIQRSGVAVHHVARSGGNAVSRYSSDLDQGSIHHLSLEAQLRRALEREELLLHYQPKLDVASGVITGMEALARWQHPERGLLSPGHFIPLAEEVGLIVPLGDWALRTACEQIKQWNTAGLKVPCVSVNLSNLQFRRPQLSDIVRETVHAQGLQPCCLCLELTESTVMESPKENARVLRYLKEAGFKLSIDDFGTGYSSLSYLKRFPLDELKVDRSFIAEIGDSEDGRAIVIGIINLARALGLLVVAEGVETEAQLEFLQAHGCDEYQGYLFSKPIPPELMAGLLKASIAPRVAAVSYQI
jgi:EAL domain-containing protein (putative c-di-GMP-specific phosphodiesterase class I)